MPDNVHLIPRPPCPAFVACSMKSGEKAWRIYHIKSHTLCSLLSCRCQPRKTKSSLRDVSSGTHPPAFRTASDKSWAWRPGNEARTMSLYPRSELDPELDSQNMVQLQLAPSAVIHV